jgi:hypothetical protein
MAVIGRWARRITPSAGRVIGWQRTGTMCGSWAWTLTATSPSGAAPVPPRASVLVLVRRLCDVVVAFVYFWVFRMHFDGGRQLCTVFFFWPWLGPVFRIHDILVWIRIRGSMPLTNGSGSASGSGSFYFHHWPSRCQQKNNLKIKVFVYITFLRYLHIIFKDKESKRCHKTVEIKVFLTIFA